MVLPRLFRGGVRIILRILESYLSKILSYPLIKVAAGLQGIIITHKSFVVSPIFLICCFIKRSGQDNLVVLFSCSRTHGFRTVFFFQSKEVIAL